MQHTGFRARCLATTLCACVCGGAVHARAQSDQTVSVSVEDVVEEPGRYYGKVVSVRAQIEDVVGPRSFTLDEDSLEATTDLFVLLPHSASGISEDTQMIVTGPVRRFVHEELRREYDWFDATADVVEEFESRPVLVAESVRSANGKEILNPELKARESGLARAGETFGDGADGNAPDREQAESGQNGAAAAPVAATLTPAAIARDPARHIGHEVIVDGRVEDVLGRTLFTLDESDLFAGPDVVVLNPRPAISVADGAKVTVSGVLRRFDWAQLRSEFPWLDLDAKLVLRLEDRPLVVAEGVAADQPPARRRGPAAGARSR